MSNQTVLEIVLFVAWIVWWLAAVNWQRLWPVLSIGAWVALVTLIFAAGLSWSQLSPSELRLFGFLRVPNVLWHIVASGSLVLVALFCGWLQGYFGWAPPEVPIEPAAAALTHDHVHGHEPEGEDLVEMHAHH